ncbi:MAG: hypothetical protein J6A28_00930 [Clostridia bacterium]|nr:hypothetical protein [Clostridia bacterium]
MNGNKKIDTTSIKGSTKKEYIINYLTALYNQTKDVDELSRLGKYVDYFVNNFSYDDHRYGEVTAEQHQDTFEYNENALYTLLTEGRGVCAQLAQAFSLLTLIDYLDSRKGWLFNYTTCRFKQSNQAVVGHAINTKTLCNKTYVIDLSSAIHSKENKYTQPSNKFYLKPLENYMHCIEKEGCQILPAEENKNYIATLQLINNIDQYYRLILSSYDELISPENNRYLGGITLPDEAENHI